MKLHDSPMLSFNRPAPVHTNMGPMSNSLPLDPWLTSPLSSATPVHSIPGFMGPAQGLQPSYPSHSFLNSAPHPHSHPHPHPSMGQGMQSMAPPPYQCSAPYSDKYPLEDVDRSSSIAALRMKAKEHIQSMDKTWQPMWLTNMTLCVGDVDRGRCWWSFVGVQGNRWHVWAKEEDCELWKLKTFLNFVFLFFFMFSSSQGHETHKTVSHHYTLLYLLSSSCWVFNVALVAVQSKCLLGGRCFKHSLHPYQYPHQPVFPSV